MMWLKPIIGNQSLYLGQGGSSPKSLALFYRHSLYLINNSSNADAMQKQDTHCVQSAYTLL